MKNLSKLFFVQFFKKVIRPLEVKPLKVIFCTIFQKGHKTPGYRVLVVPATSMGHKLRSKKLQIHNLKFLLVL